MARIGYNRCVCSQNRVRLFLSDRDGPLTSSHWSPPATSDACHIYAGFNPLWLLTPQMVPDHCSLRPENVEIIRRRRPTITSWFVLLVPTKTYENHFRDVHDIFNSRPAHSHSVCCSVEPATHEPRLSLSSPDLSQSK